MPEVVIHTTLGVVMFIISNELVSMVTNFNFVSEKILVNPCINCRSSTLGFTLIKYDLRKFDKLTDYFADFQFHWVSHQGKVDASMIWSN